MPSKQNSEFTEKYIIPAGQVGTFIVCPEAWRYEAIEFKNTKTKSAKVRNSLKSQQGRELHLAWAEKFDRYFFLLKGAKYILRLIILALIVLLIGARF